MIDRYKSSEPRKTPSFIAGILPPMVVGVLPYKLASHMVFVANHSRALVLALPGSAEKNKRALAEPQCHWCAPDDLFVCVECVPPHSVSTKGWAFSPWAENRMNLFFFR